MKHRLSLPPNETNHHCWWQKPDHQGMGNPLHSLFEGLLQETNFCFVLFGSTSHVNNQALEGWGRGPSHSAWPIDTEIFIKSEIAHTRENEQGRIGLWSHLGEQKLSPLNSLVWIKQKLELSTRRYARQLCTPLMPVAGEVLFCIQRELQGVLISFKSRTDFFSSLTIIIIPKFTYHKL